MSNSGFPRILRPPQQPQKSDFRSVLLPERFGLTPCTFGTQKGILQSSSASGLTTGIPEASMVLNYVRMISLGSSKCNKYFNIPRKFPVLSVFIHGSLRAFVHMIQWQYGCFRPHIERRQGNRNQDSERGTIHELGKYRISRRAG